MVSFHSCADKPVILHSYNVKDQYFNRFQAVLDENKCQILTKKINPIHADDPSLDGYVMISRKDYARLHAEFKNKCEGSK